MALLLSDPQLKRLKIALQNELENAQQQSLAYAKLIDSDPEDKDLKQTADAWDNHISHLHTLIDNLQYSGISSSKPLLLSAKKAINREFSRLEDVVMERKVATSVLKELGDEIQARRIMQDLLKAVENTLEGYENRQSA